ncbi:MAG: SpoIID/LytB domain-containing protein [Synechococcus sp.]|nr:SpoIID/LytB domain-containing protein [Synechococcus sp.]
MWFTPSLRTMAPLPLLAAALPSALVPAIVQPAGVQARGSEPELRVLLQEGPSLEIGATTTPLRLSDGRGRMLLELPPGSGVRLSAAGAVLRAEPLAGAVGQGSRSFPLTELWVEPLATAPRAEPQSQDAAPAFLLQQKSYRGRLQLLRGNARLQAINVIGIESYLPSVVGSEMPASWPLEALRAQAVAARTYALRQRKPAAPFDLTATVASQVYKGLAAETPSTREAVASTRSQVLLHGNTLINAVFHSSGGGITENSGDLWSRQLPYLVSVPDYDDSSPVREWQVRLEPEKLRQAFPETGGVQRIEVLGTTASGRVRQARVTGPSGSLLVSGPDLRTRLGLRSTLVRFELLQPELASLPLPPPPSPLGVPGEGREAPPLMPAIPAMPLQVPQPALLAIGRGFGHGVGMSQWGAYTMARQGSSYDQILRHYYQGAEVRPLPR